MCDDAERLATIPLPRVRAMIAEARAQAAAEERVACAALLDDKAADFRQQAAEARDDGLTGTADHLDERAELLECAAAAIRARGGPPP